MSELGDKLRNARLEKGYSIDDLQKITKIQKRYLTAIEDGDFSHLPGDFYVRAFVKQYAQSVGLDSDEVFAEFANEIPQVQTDEPRDEVQVVKKESLFSNLKRHWPQITILAVVLAIVVLIGVVIAQAHRQNDNQIPSSNQTKVEKVEPSNKKKKAKKPAKSEAKKEEQEPKELSIEANPNEADHFNITNWKSSSEHVVLVEASTANAWITFKVGNDILWQGTVSAGSNKSIDVAADASEFQIQTGNAKATKIKINDKEVPIPADQTGMVHNYTMTIKE